MAKQSARSGVCWQVSSTHTPCFSVSSKQEPCFEIINDFTNNKTPEFEEGEIDAGYNVHAIHQQHGYTYMVVKTASPTTNNGTWIDIWGSVISPRADGKYEYHPRYKATNFIRAYEPITPEVSIPFTQHMGVDGWLYLVFDEFNINFNIEYEAVVEELLIKTEIIPNFVNQKYLLSKPEAKLDISQLNIGEGCLLMGYYESSLDTPIILRDGDGSMFTVDPMDLTLSLLAIQPTNYMLGVDIMTNSSSTALYYTSDGGYGVPNPMLGGHSVLPYGLGETGGYVNNIMYHDSLRADGRYGRGIGRWVGFVHNVVGFPLNSSIIHDMQYVIYNPTARDDIGWVGGGNSVDSHIYRNIENPIREVPLAHADASVEMVYKGLVQNWYTASSRVSEGYKRLKGADFHATQALHDNQIRITTKRYLLFASEGKLYSFQPRVVGHAHLGEVQVIAPIAPSDDFCHNDVYNIVMVADGTPTIKHYRERHQIL